MIIAIEIDKIISSPVENSYKLTDVQKCTVLPGAREALEKLKKLNHIIFIYSKRDVSLGIDTQVWLKKNKIPYDTVMFSKPEYDIVLDEQAYQFKNWNKFFKKYEHILKAR